MDLSVRKRIVADIYEYIFCNIILCKLYMNYHFLCNLYNIQWCWNKNLFFHEQSRNQSDHVRHFNRFNTAAAKRKYKIPFSSKKPLHKLTAMISFHIAVFIFARFKYNA